MQNNSYEYQAYPNNPKTIVLDASAMPVIGASTFSIPAEHKDNFTPTEVVHRAHMAQMWPHTKDMIGECGGPDINIPNAPKIVMTDSLREQIKGRSKEAVKFDNGKIDWTLVPFEALEGMVKVLEFGAKKYAAWNWTEGDGFKWTRLVGSCLRHLFAWARGQDLDPESGLSHIYHAQCNLLFLAYYLGNKEKFNKDDRNVR